MSSAADASAAATIAIFDSLYTGAYCNVAASVLFIYDAFVTFDREVAFFWTAKPTGALLLFLANKWISLTFYVLGMVSYMSFPSDKSCLWFAIAVQAMEILQFFPGAAFSALRVYVLSRSKPLGLLVATLSLAPVGANLVLFGHQYSGANFPPFGCLSSVNTTPALNLRLVIISRVPLIAADILLVYITWTKLSSSATLADIRQSKRRSLTDTLFRGGVIYFVILFALNVLHLLLTATAVALDVASGSYVTAFTAPLTAILVSRFLLDLQEANQMVVRLDPDDPLHSSRGSYDSAPSFISSLGGFVNPNPSERSDDEDGLHLQVRLHSGAPEVQEDVGVQAVPFEGAAASLSPTA